MAEAKRPIYWDMSSPSLMSPPKDLNGSTGENQGSSRNGSHAAQTGSSTESRAPELATIQSILIGDFSAETTAAIESLSRSLARLRKQSQERISQLEAQLDKERHERELAVVALEEAQQEAAAATNHAIGRVKADVTRGRRALRQELGQLREQSIDRAAFAATLRSIASQVEPPEAEPAKS